MKSLGKHPSLVLIIGISPRSGTNYLSNIVNCFDGFEPVEIAKEDHLFEKAYLLEKFSRDCTSRWIPWNDESYDALEAKQKVMQGLGDGLVASFRNSLEDRKATPVLKTPITFCTRNRLLDSDYSSIYELFPDAKVILLTRNSTDTIMSAHRTWPKKPFLLIVLRWIMGARHILKIVEGAGSQKNNQPLLVKYEEIIQRPIETAKKIGTFLQQDANISLESRVRDLPIIGSSKTKDKNGNVTWEPVSKNEVIVGNSNLKMNSFKALTIKLLTSYYQKALVD